jgi:hypothetical protein
MYLNRDRGAKVTSERERLFLKQSVPRDSICGGIRMDLSEPSANMFASRVVTIGIDGAEERIDIPIHRPATDLLPRYSIGI